MGNCNLMNKLECKTDMKSNIGTTTTTNNNNTGNDSKDNNGDLVSIGIIIPNKTKKKDFWYECIVDMSDKSIDVDSVLFRQSIRHIIYEITIYVGIPELRKCVEYQSTILPLDFEDYLEMTPSNKQRMYILHYRKNYWIYYYVQVKCRAWFESISASKSIKDDDKYNDEEYSDNDNINTSNRNKLPGCVFMKEKDPDINQCPIISYLLNDNGYEITNDISQDNKNSTEKTNNINNPIGDNATNINNMLQHLYKFDHFASFNLDKPQCECNYTEDCSLLLNVNSNNKCDTQHVASNQYMLNRAHLYLYKHRSRKKRRQKFLKFPKFQSQTIQQVETTNTSNNTNEPNDAVDSGFFVYKKDGTFKPIGIREFDCRYMSVNHGVCLFIQELIQNGFEQDLLPLYDVNNDKKSYDTIRGLCQTLTVLQEKLNNRLNGAVKHNLCDICEMDVSDIIMHCDKMVKSLEKYYHIFSILAQKMKHQRHTEMKCPLSEPMMLSLIIYCNGECTYDLTDAQRIQKQLFYDIQYFKWYHFDFLLNYAIQTLSHYENHFENIYTGLCDVILNYKSTSALRGYAFLQTNTSFTTDLEVAKEFRGSWDDYLCKYAIIRSLQT